MGWVDGCKILCVHTCEAEFFSFFTFLCPHLWHIEVPGLGVESELQLPAYNIAMAILEPIQICSVHLSLWAMSDP